MYSADLSQRPGKSPAVVGVASLIGLWRYLGWPNMHTRSEDGPIDCSDEDEGGVGKLDQGKVKDVEVANRVELDKPRAMEVEEEEAFSTGDGVGAAKSEAKQTVQPTSTTAEIDKLTNSITPLGEEGKKELRKGEDDKSDVDNDWEAMDNEDSLIIEVMDALTPTIATSSNSATAARVCKSPPIAISSASELPSRSTPPRKPCKNLTLCSDTSVEHNSSDEIDAPYISELVSNNTISNLNVENAVIFLEDEYSLEKSKSLHIQADTKLSTKDGDCVVENFGEDKEVLDVSNCKKKGSNECKKSATFASSVTGNSNEFHSKIDALDISCLDDIQDIDFSEQFEDHVTKKFSKHYIHGDSFDNVSPFPDLSLDDIIDHIDHLQTTPVSADASNNQHSTMPESIDTKSEDIVIEGVSGSEKEQVKLDYDAVSCNGEENKIIESESNVVNSPKENRNISKITKNLTPPAGNKLSQSASDPTNAGLYINSFLFLNIIIIIYSVIIIYFY